jgi:adenylate cyclase
VVVHYHMVEYQRFVINGCTGSLERSINLPAVSSHFNRWEHATIADFRGTRERRGGRLSRTAHRAAASRPASSRHGRRAPDRRNFLMVQRSPEGVLDTKVIEHDGAERRVTWYRRDREGQIEAVEEDPADTYDPHTRSWYRGATSVDGLFGTDVYIFFTAQRPGLTASRAVSGPDHRVLAVAGGDIALEALSDFLAGLEIGKSGQAMIIDAEGRLVAFPDPTKVVDAANGEFRPAQLAELGEPLLTKVYDRIRVTGDGRSMLWSILGDDVKRRRGPRRR